MSVLVRKVETSRGSWATITIHSVDTPETGKTGRNLMSQRTGDIAIRLVQLQRDLRDLLIVTETL